MKCLNQENITDPGLVMLKPRPLQLELTLSLTIDRLVRSIQLRFLVSITKSLFDPLNPKV